MAGNAPHARVKREEPDCLPRLAKEGDPIGAKHRSCHKASALERDMLKRDIETCYCPA